MRKLLCILGALVSLAGVIIGFGLLMLSLAELCCIGFEKVNVAGTLAGLGIFILSLYGGCQVVREWFR